MEYLCLIYGSENEAEEHSNGAADHVRPRVKLTAHLMYMG